MQKTISSWMTLFTSKLGRQFFILVAVSVFGVMSLMGLYLLWHEYESLDQASKMLANTLTQESGTVKDSLQTLGDDSRADLMAAIQGKGQSLAALLAGLGADAVSAGNLQGLSALLEPLKRQKDFIYAAFNDTRGRKLATAGTRSPKREEIFEFSFPIEVSGQKVGSFALEMSRSVLSDRVRYSQDIIHSTMDMKESSLQNALQQTKIFTARRLRLAFFSLASVIAITIFLLLAALAFFFKRLFLDPIQHLSIMIATNQNDLTRRIQMPRQDELGQLAESFNRFLENMRQIIQQTTALIDQLNVSLEEITATAEEMKASAETVSDTVQSFMQDLHNQESQTSQAAATITAVSGSLLELTKQSENSTQTFVETESISRQGRETVKDSVEKIDTISSNMNVIDQRMQSLSQSLGRIGEFAKAIQGIAAKTNMLSLNAAIEAARAGEAGRGFSVVAEEVRKLAENAAGSSGQIQTLVMQVEAETKATSLATHRGTASVTGGRDAVHQAGESLEAILAKMDQAAHLSKQVSRSLQEQTQSLKAMMERIIQVERVGKNNFDAAQSIAASVEEQTASLDEMNSSLARLSDHSSRLKDMIVGFKVK